MVDLSERYLKKKRTAFLNFFYFALISFLIILIFGAIFLLLPQLRISQLEIFGDVKKDEVANILNELLVEKIYKIIPKSSYVLFSEANVSALLLKNGFGLSNVKKKFPNTLKIEFVKSGAPWLIYCKTQEDCFFIDKAGVITERAPFFSEKPIPELVLNIDKKLGEAVLERASVKFLLEGESQYLKNEIRMSKIELLKEDEIKIYSKEGWYLYTSVKLEPEKLFNNLMLLFDQKIDNRRKDLEYIDMRFQNKAFYKFK